MGLSSPSFQQPLSSFSYPIPIIDRFEWSFLI